VSAEFVRALFGSAYCQLTRVGHIGTQGIDAGENLAVGLGDRYDRCRLLFPVHDGVGVDLDGDVVGQ
jgi:hypothetical protein